MCGDRRAAKTAERTNSLLAGLERFANLPASAHFNLSLAPAMAAIGMLPCDSSKCMGTATTTPPEITLNQ